MFPNEKALGGLLELLNQKELEHLWTEDETIGWIYQYWNSKEERKAMRDASAAPRNSRELAVRNQFFTPRYVVEFLTDNTLGRTWYEMTKGETRLADQCRYLVRRPTEIFLNDGGEPPQQPEQDGLSQEELLKQPVYIQHRSFKDPREIRLLDPACGSMHFGLYAFDLFEAIYEEGWEKSIGTLKQDFPDKTEFLAQVPRLIIENNIHGVDIDPRAVQIAGLSLWLRAQRSWKNQSVQPGNRPEIRKSNIVCAEPMPGDEAMLEEFLETLNPPLLRDLVRTVFEKMKLAGEAGTLLKIEEEIRSAIEDARNAAHAMRDDLLTQGEAESDDFFDSAEEQIYEALQNYAESAESGDYQRRLFAEDAAHGFAFIDLCRKRYDAVVMNPPFGDASENILHICDQKCPAWNRNILCAFIEQNLTAANNTGFVASVIDRSFLNKSTYEDFRENCLLRDDLLDFVLDLGWEVLDANVEVSSVILRPSLYTNNPITQCIDIRDIASGEKGNNLLKIVADGWANSKNIYQHQTSAFSFFPNQSVVYDLPEELLSAFTRHKNLKAQGLTSFTGHQLESFRHFMLFWELPLNAAISPQGDYCHLYNGGEYSRFANLPQDVVRFGFFANLRPQDVPSYTYVLRNKDQHFLPGVCFGVRGDILDAHLLPKGHLFTVEGQALPISDRKKVFLILAFLNSAVASRLLNTFSGQHKYSGYVNLLPFPQPEPSIEEKLINITEKAVKLLRNAFTFSENSLVFSVPSWVGVISSSILRDSLGLFNQLGLEEKQLQEIFEQTNALCMELYGIDSQDVVSDLNSYSESFPKGLLPGYNGSTLEKFKTSVCTNIMSYSLGLTLGRWDIRKTIGEFKSPQLSDVFEPLPGCPPGMLQNADGLPASESEVSEDYPLRISWPGILVDDEGHPEDIITRVRDALSVIWKDNSASIEQEACEILKVKSLRDYFAEKKSGGKFFKDHLKRYSKPRRKAPIYWPLSTESGSYTLWIYYHRLTDQTLYQCVSDFIEPKIEQFEKDLQMLNQQFELGQADGKTNDQISELKALVNELKNFRDDLLNVAKLPYKPNLNDGVQITAAPLWKCFRLGAWQKTLKDTWKKLEKGDYDWAHLSYSIWPERVKDKCIKDKSLAIAHGLEEVYIEPPAKAKKAKKASTEALGLE